MKDLTSSSTKLFKYLLLLTVISTFYFQITEKWTNGNHKNIIYSDALGYYAYLPAAFIYHDMNFGFQTEYENKYYDAKKRTNFCNEINGKRTDKYFSGVSVLLLPFFLLACLFSKIFGYEVDGYSYFFQVSVGVAALFYLIIGLIYLRKLLLYYCNERTAVFLVFAFFFGTNLLYYTWVEPAMSHVYSFAAIAAFLYYLKLSIGTNNKRDLLLASFFYGLIILIRPSNAVIIFALPFLADSWENLKQFFQELFGNAKLLIAPVLLCGGIVFIQLLVFHAESGHWIVYSYTGEKFDFSRPEFMNVLFSYRKGLFIYTPIAFISLGGLIVLIRTNRFAYTSIFLLFALTIWIISSWWCWWYGGSFGQRSFIEYFPLFAILLGIFYSSIKRMLGKVILVIVILLCVYLNLFQTWQFYKCILPPDGLTKEKYATLFLQSNTRYVGVYGDELNVPQALDTQGAIILKYDLESTPKELFDTNTFTDEKALSGKHSSKMSGKMNKSVSFTKKIGDIIPKLDPDSNYTVQVKFSAWLASSGSDAKVVMYFQHGNDVKNWQGYFVAHQVTEEKKWMNVVSHIQIPKDIGVEDTVWIYVLKENSYDVYIDDLEVDLIKNK